MKISSILIRNFKTIRELNIDNIESAFIIVGKNSTGKTTILKAILAVAGEYAVKVTDFNDPNRNIEIAVNLEITNADILELHSKGKISKYKSFDMWYEDFCNQLPTFVRGGREPDSDSYEQEDQAEILEEMYSPDNGINPSEYGGLLSFSFVVDTDLSVRYSDGINKNNPSLKKIFPKVYFFDVTRNVREIQDSIFNVQTKSALKKVKDTICMYDESRPCTRCFRCIPDIIDKKPDELSILETTKLLEYKLGQLNMDEFIERLNRYYIRNSGRKQDIEFMVKLNTKELFMMDTVVMQKDHYGADSVETLSAGAKSIYILSLLEAYVDENSNISSIIMIEDPEIYLHPQLQKTASEILYRLSKKNQVIFSTHSPNMIFNFKSSQINQVVLDKDYNTTISENTDINRILDDLGYSAGDVMNVNFVFIVEGKQDSNRLPLLLKKYYSEVYNDDGTLQRISIITTNSCTNIKTYANLKYINQLYLKDQFLMIRDSDGKKPETLVKQLCSYYSDRAKEDPQNIPRITRKNVLVLKYYSFENYFLNPKIMAKIGVIKTEEEFYNILLAKFKNYLYRLPCARRMREVTGLMIRSKEDLKRNMETFKIYMRGHNLFDIFYGRYKGEEENEILMRYIEEAPREEFADILNAIDNFIYFMNRRREDEELGLSNGITEVYKGKHKHKNKYNRG
ncbi:MAG: ATP-binding protein [Lachnospiraceae bacterium]|nr:AAA family ATPase [Lachnospiraceae bacterium]MCR4993583.1 ATP-binding protein [Lachnospiraceae bacterium]